MSSLDASKPPYRFTLQPSEMAIFRSASEIFAAYIVNNQVTDENKGNYYRIAIQDAIAIAMTVEQSIDSDDELSSTSKLGKGFC